MKRVRELRRVPDTTGTTPRPRLLADDPVTVLVAPGGWGKTVVAAQHAASEHDRGGTVAWAQLTASTDSADDLLEILNVPGPAAASSVAGAILDANAGAADLLVIDGFEFAGDPLERAVAELASRVSDCPRLLICGTRRPSGLLGRLGGRARVVGVDALAFTPDEVATVLGASRGAQATDDGLAMDWHRATGGWPAGIALAAAVGGPPTSSTARLVGRAAGPGTLLDPDTSAAAELLLAVGWASPLVATVGEVAWDAVKALAGASPLVIADPAHGPSAVCLLPMAEEHVGGLVSPSRRAVLATSVADAMAVDHPVRAIDLLIAAGHAGPAADLLARHAENLGDTVAVERFHQLPERVRHRLPSTIADKRATVRLTEAASAAELALGSATAPEGRASARLRLGAALLGAGHLGEAARHLEQVITGGGPSADGPTADEAQLLLARCRFHLGDHAGVRAALEATTETAWSRHLDGLQSLAEGDVATARAVAGRARALVDRGEERDRAAAGALEAVVALACGEPDAAGAAAAQAYASALRVGGQALGAAAWAHATVLIAAGRTDAAGQVVRTLHDSVGHADASARLRAHVLRRAIARHDGDEEGARQAEALIDQHRGHGYVTDEALTDHLAGRHPLGRMRPAPVHG